MKHNNASQNFLNKISSSEIFNKKRFLIMKFIKEI